MTLFHYLLTLDSVPIRHRLRSSEENGMDNSDSRGYPRGKWGKSMLTEFSGDRVVDKGKDGRNSHIKLRRSSTDVENRVSPQTFL